MTRSIAITGKGGVGKTTVSALLVNRLVQRGLFPVLAVDADPNSCLDNALGVKVLKTVGGVREEARQIASGGMKGGISKQQLLELKISESLIETEHFDLIAMGRPEGPGCYCYANNVLKQIIAAISASYPYIVIDNEAGLENLSRRIVQKVNMLVIVTNPTRAGFDTALRLYALAKEMEIVYDKLVVVVNNSKKNTLPEFFNELASMTDAETMIIFPYCTEIEELAEYGRPLSLLEEKSEVIKSADRLLDMLVQDKNRMISL